jgi:Flp pilus assembly protein TadG
MMSRQFCMSKSKLQVSHSGRQPARNKHPYHSRNRNGGAIVEAGASMALLLPVLLILMWAITQVSQYFILKQQLSFVARQAAREISYAYGTLGYTSMNSGGGGSGAANTGDSNYLQIVNAISVPGVINVNSNSQFKVYFSIPNSPSLAQSYVTATVTYKSGTNLPKFPWNPLNTGFLKFDTTGVVINSSCSWPIPHS